MKAPYALVLILLALFGVAGCGEDPPPPTPIPGFVGGEERYAYASFIALYDEQLQGCAAYDEYLGVDTDYPGTGVYVGGGLWRFHVQIYSKYAGPPEYDLEAGDGSYIDPPVSYREEMVEAQSLPDRTWGRLCYDRDDYDRDQQYDYPDEPDFVEPPDVEWGP